MKWSEATQASTRPDPLDPTPAVWVYIKSILRSEGCGVR